MRRARTLPLALRDLDARQRATFCQAMRNEFGRWRWYVGLVLSGAVLAFIVLAAWVLV